VTTLSPPLRLASIAYLLQWTILVLLLASDVELRVGVDNIFHFIERRGDLVSKCGVDGAGVREECEQNYDYYTLPKS